MKLYVLGSGNILSKKRSNTSFLLECDQDYLIDCPYDIFKKLYRINKDPNIVNNIILTHTHADHLGSLESFLFYKGLIQKKKLNLYTTKSIYENAKQKLENICSIFNNNLNLLKLSFDDYINYFELTTDQPFEKNNFKIEIRNNLHPVPTIGLKIRYNNKLLAYSSDTKYDVQLIEELYKQKQITIKQKNDLLGFLWDADFIIHEASDSKDIHTHINTLENLPPEIKNKLYLAHVPDNLQTNLKILEKYEVYDLSYQPSLI